MKNLLLSITVVVLQFLANTANADCKTAVETFTQTTPAADYLKDAQIVVKLRNGKEYVMSSAEYMVVPRTQVKESKTVLCSVPAKAQATKNLLAVGARRDAIGLTVDADAHSAHVTRNKGIVLDASYYRRDILGPLGAGASLDTNGIPRAMLGLDF